MARNIITAIFFIVLSVFAALNIMSCSDLYDNPVPWPGDLEVEQEPEYDLDNSAAKDPENSPGNIEKSNYTNLFNLQKQYQVDCYKHEWYFCPPALYLDEIWQFQLVIDTCKDPEEIVYKGECEQLFECDPSDVEPETVLCSVPVSTGGNIYGSQEKWCDKGVWKYTDCVACSPEICDGIDNDCNGEIDDLPIQECENECGPGELVCVDGEEICFGDEPDEEVCDYKDNDCDGLVDEDQTNACGDCGAVPEEVCDGFDNDCNGEIDEQLEQLCQTDCETGVEFCVLGSWIGCTAAQPFAEICNGLDDDCDGDIDEDLDCLCTIEMVGALFPCYESPLICGMGYKTCECFDPSCEQIFMSECYAMCSYQEPMPLNCDKYKGLIIDEICNNHDDNCNQVIDENLFKGCYSGDPETLFIGICVPGLMTCDKGSWGSYYEDGETFVDGFCKGEVVPLEVDECNGEDDNCDGIIDDGQELKDTDIVFIIDSSGSMQDEIDGVLIALNQFATYYKDEEVIQWGLVMGPFSKPKPNSWGTDQYSEIISNLAPFSDFIGALAGIDADFTSGVEAIYDLIYLSLWNLAPSSALPWPVEDLSFLYDLGFSGLFSIPDPHVFEINWREDAQHVLIVFTDEPGQSYLSAMSDLSDINTVYQDGLGSTHGINQIHLKQLISNCVDLNVYTFTKQAQKVTTFAQQSAGFEELTIYGGQWFELVSNPAQLYENLMQIIDENACE
jgi:hypothetical protein